VRKLGEMSIALVTTENITDSLDVLLKRGTHETARRVLGDLEKAFDWARGKGWRSDANPCSGVGVIIDQPKKVGHRAPEVAELGGIVSSLQTAQGAGVGLDFDYDTRLARLLLLTGARTSEIRLARWDEVFDLDGDMPRIDVPESRMKKRKPWTCVLSAQSAAILRELRDNAAQWGDGASPLIFMKYKKSGLGVVSNENAVNVVLKRAGLHAKVVGHGFRKLFSTAAHSSWPYSGNNREKAIEHSLAHVNTQTVEHVYNKSEFLTERALLAQWWADHCDRVAAGDGGTVVEFKKVSVG
jgi:integrase